jgi:hypothetical protein
MSARQIVLLFFGLLVACAPAADRAQRADASGMVRPPDSSANRPKQDSISRLASVSHEDRTLLHPGAIPPAVHVACDSATVITREALALTVHREEGSYFDSSRETPRTGCRLTGKGSFKTVPDQSGPVDALHNSFIRHRWRHDLRYGADGPDGASVGMRFRDMLCLVAGRWNGGDDSDPDTSRARTNEDDSYQIFVECARDVALNNDGEVPDSIWSVATNAGLDSVYAISMSVRSPPYVDGDFDGDGVMDAAVLVERRSTGKIGLAIVHHGTRQVTILGAGTGSAGPDDLEWIDRWERFHKESIDLTIRDRPNTRFVGDAIWVARGDSVSGFYGWTGRTFVYEAHRR